MRKKLNRIHFLVLAIIFLSFLIGFYFYPRFPEKVASHWNSRGEVDGYVSKFWGLFLMPILTLILFFLFLIIPEIDPLKRNVEKFRKYFDYFILILVLFLFYLYILTLLWNLGKKFNIIQVLVPAFSGLFFYCGVLVEKAKRNWFIGIRTPWTLSNDKVWDETHRIGGKLFKIIGLISLLGLFLPRYFFFIMLLPLIFLVFFLFFFSYFKFKKLSKS